MVLVDTSVWIDHLRGGDRRLEALLEVGGVIIHPFVVGELACGNLRNRSAVLSLLRQLPEAREATHPEVLQFIENKRLMGRIGYVDAHLLAATALSDTARLWTHDQRLGDAAAQLSCDFKPNG
jgi:hypothetical protein